MNFHPLLAALRLASGSWLKVALKIVLTTLVINHWSGQFIYGSFDPLKPGLLSIPPEVALLSMSMPSVIVIAIECAYFRRLLALTPNPRLLILMALLPSITLVGSFLFIIVPLFFLNNYVTLLTVISILVAIFAIFSQEKLAFMSLAYPLGISGIILTAQSDYTRPLIIAFSIYVVIWQILQERKADRTPQPLIPHISLRALANFLPAGKK